MPVTLLLSTEPAIAIRNIGQENSAAQDQRKPQLPAETGRLLAMPSGYAVGRLIGEQPFKAGHRYFRQLAGGNLP